MLVVTGTGRCGSAMWLQVLQAAGMPVLGQAFGPRQDPRFNPKGYFESALMHGIHAGSNPDPVSGAELLPEMPAAVKVSIPGVALSDRRYLDRVLLSARPWRDYAASVGRLHRALGMATGGDEDCVWFIQHLRAMQDAAARGWSPKVLWLPDVVASPAESITEVVAWLGLPLDAAAGVRAIVPALLHPGRPQKSAWEAELARMEDWLAQGRVWSAADLRWGADVAEGMQRA